MQPFDELARNYDDLLRDPLRDKFAGGSDFFIEQKCRIVSARLDAGRASCPPGTRLRVLDAGCGQGTAFRFFGAEHAVFGCDVSAAMLHGAAGRRAVAVQEPFDLPFTDDTFDAAYAFCVYHHIDVSEHVRHLTELRRVVRPGGEVMVFEHNPHNPVTARIFRRAPVDRGCEMIPPAQLRRTFRDAGFTHIDHGYLLFVPEAVHRRVPFLESMLSRVPLGGQYFVAGRKTE